MIDLIGLVILVPSFVLIERRVHWEAQTLFYNLTHRLDVALVIFSLFLLPGVIVHELSHFLMAKLLGVSTGRFSLIPKTLPNGKLRLGYVETVKVDFLRDSLIGFAPLLIGSILIGVIGVSKLHLLDILNSFIQDPLHQIKPSLLFLVHQPDIWLWFYLLFAISSTMIPSASDRRSWFLILVFILLIALIAWLLGGAVWLVNIFRAPANSLLRAFNLIIGLSLIAHILVWLPLFGMRYLTKMK